MYLSNRPDALRRLISFIVLTILPLAPHKSISDDIVERQRPASNLC